MLAAHAAETLGQLAFRDLLVQHSEDGQLENHRTDDDQADNHQAQTDDHQVEEHQSEEDYSA